MDPEHRELLEVVRNYLEAPDASDFVVAELREFEHLFGLALKEKGLSLDTEITSMCVLARGENTASVATDRKFALRKGSERVWEAEETLEIHAIYDEGWRVADTVKDGLRHSERARRVLVEPRRAEGFTVRAAAITHSSEETRVAFSIYNGTDQMWRFQSASVELRTGPLRFLVPFVGKKVRGGAVRLEPGSEHAVSVAVPSQAERIWIRLRGPWSLRSLIFALSWERPQPVQTRTRTWPYLVPHLALKVWPLVVATVLATLLTNPLTWLLYFGYPLVLLHDTWRGVRLERLLARFRAAPA